jgi:hypothetical protein
MKELSHSVGTSLEDVDWIDLPTQEALGKEKYSRLKPLCAETGQSVLRVRQLLRDSKITGAKVGGLWFTTLSEVQRSKNL